MTTLSCNLMRMELNLSDSRRITPSASDVWNVDHQEAKPCTLLPLVAGEIVTMIGLWPRVVGLDRAHSRVGGDRQ